MWGSTTTRKNECAMTKTKVIILLGPRSPLITEAGQVLRPAACPFLLMAGLIPWFTMDITTGRQYFRLKAGLTLPERTSGSF
jgi:hypothetical protein